MVDWWLIVIAVIVPVILVGINLIILARYLDPEDRRGHLLSKIFILLGLLIAECCVLLLPFDVGNRAGVVGCGFWNDNCGGLDLEVLWQIIYVIIVVLIAVIFPYLIFYYESTGTETGKMARARDALHRRVQGSCRCCDCAKATCAAFTYTLITLILVVAVVVATYSFLAKTHIPYQVVLADYSSADQFPSTGGSAAPTNLGGFQDAVLEMDVSFIIYMAALFSFIGSFLFAIYAGVGLVAIPMDYIQACRVRPRPLKEGEARNMKLQLQQRAESLMKYGEEMAEEMVDWSDLHHSKSERRKMKKVSAQRMNKYAALVKQLEDDADDYERLNPANFKKYYNPLGFCFKIIVGIFAGLLSILWIAHIIIYMVVDAGPFINSYLSFFEQYFALMGTVSVSVLSLYLLLAVMKGSFKLGTRFFLCKVHPMERGRTLLNSFIFNVILVLLCTIPVVQFTYDAFHDWARLTDADVIFGIQIKNMEFFRYLFQNNVFEYIILGFALLTLIYLSFCPSDRDYLNKVLHQITTEKRKERQAMQRQMQA